MSNDRGGIASILNGRPTEREAAAILEHAKGLKYDDLIPYETMEKLAGVKHTGPDASRFRTVVGAARRKILRELHIDLHCVRNEGYKLLHPNEQVRKGVRVFRGGVRRLGKAAVLVEVADRNEMDERGKLAADFIATRTLDVVLSLRKETRALAHVGTTHVLPWGDGKQ